VRLDIVLSIGFFIVAFFLRIGGPVTGASDEAYHFSEMIGLKTLAVTPVVMSATSYPYALHQVIFELWTLLDRFIEPFYLEKLLSAGSAACSVAAVYLLVRAFYPVHVALSAGILICFMGWHWVNSRFIYVYPHDLALMSLGALFVVFAFETRSFTWAAACGLILGSSLVFKKVSVATLFFFVAACLQYLVLSSKQDKKRIVLVFLCASFVGCATCVPIYHQFISDSNHSGKAFFVYQQAINARSSYLNSTNWSTVWALAYPIVDGFQQLVYGDTPESIRHVLRIGKPLLDPMLSCCFIIGIVAALRDAFKRRNLILLFTGLLVFMLPMALAIPHPIARRMLGVSFFIAWFGALGAREIARRCLGQKWIPVGTVALCLGSAVLNVYYFFSVYSHQPPDNWEGPNGLSRAAAIMSARGAAREGMLVVVLDNHWIELRRAVTDLTNVKVVKSLEEARQVITATRPATVKLIISRHDYHRVGAISDIISEDKWKPGPTMPNGPPMIYSAEI
jgi:hypothetical protein